MRTIIVALFASCVVSLAQISINTDSHGYVTNAALLMPFTVTNAAGEAISNVVLVKLTPNNFIYKTPDGNGGMMRLENLPKDLQEKFGYDPQAAQAVNEADTEKKKRQEQFFKQQKEAAAQDAYWAAALKNSVAPFIHHKRVIGGWMVNLAPLFLWWKSTLGQTNNTGEPSRPLSAWIHITGTILGSDGNYWIVNAKIEASPGKSTQTKIALQNPPADEQRQFASAGAELKQINDRIFFVATSVSSAFDDANGVAQSINTASALNASSAQYWALVNKKQQIENRKASLIQEEDNLKLRREELWQFMKQFPSGNTYQLNIFAMKTGNVLNGLTLYDVGVCYP